MDSHNCRWKTVFLICHWESELGNVKILFSICGWLNLRMQNKGVTVCIEKNVHRSEPMQFELFCSKVNCIQVSVPLEYEGIRNRHLQVSDGWVLMINNKTVSAECPFA